MDFLKAEQVGKNKWRVLAIPFVGHPTTGKDTDEEFFSPNTDIRSHWFGGERPVIWHHNLDSTFKADPEIGKEDDLEMEDDGWWATVWLDRAHRYWSRIDQWLREGKMYGSSGTLPNFVDVDRKTGEILRWPHVEQTLTLTPANPFAVVRAAKAAMNLDLDSQEADLRSDLPAEGGDDAAIQRLTGAIERLEELLKPNPDARRVDVESRLADLEARLQNL